MVPVVYSQPNCHPCKATMRAFDKAGINVEVIDISADVEARNYVMGLGHQTTPVVVAGNEHWSGFRPDRIKALAA